MTRFFLLVVTLGAACGAPKPPPASSGSPIVEPQPPPAAEPVAAWAATVTVAETPIPARELPPAVVVALLELLYMPDAMAPLQLQYVRPLADGAGLVAFAAERSARIGSQLDGITTYALAEYAGGKFTLVATAKERWSGSPPEERALAARDVDGDGAVELVVGGDELLARAR